MSRLRRYRWRGSAWLFLPGSEPEGAVPVEAEAADEAASAPVESKEAAPENKSRRARTKSKGTSERG